MRKFTVFANCQSGAIAKTILENNEFTSKYKYIPINPVQNLKPGDAKYILSIVRNVDLFIYQSIAETSLRPRELSSNYLLENLKLGADHVSFPSLYFDGYFPHLQTFMGRVSKLNLVHDYFIAYLCSLRFSERDIYELIQSEFLYPKELSNNLVDKSLNNLENREITDDINICVSSYIKENYKKEKLFNQFNHPKRKVFKFLGESIFKKIGVNDYIIKESGASHLDGIITPIYRSTYNNLGLVFAEDFNSYTKGKESGISQKEIISGFYDFYKTIDPCKIQELVINTKPFIKEIIDNI